MEKVIHIIPTPIGNLEDITFRAVRLLNEVDLILAEDTRVTKKLLNHYEIKTKMSSYHSFNEHKQLSNIITKINGLLKVLLRKSEEFSDKNTDIKSKNKDDLSFVTTVISKKFCLLIFLIT